MLWTTMAQLVVAPMLWTTKRTAVLVVGSWQAAKLVQAVEAQLAAKQMQELEPRLVAKEPRKLGKLKLKRKQMAERALLSLQTLASCVANPG